MAINIIGMPIFVGSDKPGCNFGPDKLREMELVEEIKAMGFDVKDLGNVEVKEVAEGHKYTYHKKLKYFDVVVDANTKLAFKVYESISKGNFPLIVGGDHSLGMGSIAGVSKHVKNLGVIWIDAHGDLNTQNTTITGNIHGMPLAASMGHGPDKLVNLFEHRVKVMDENIVHIGARDLDEGEVDLLNNSNIKAFKMDDVKTMGIERVIEESISYLKDRVDGVHVSFDIDSIDSIYVPGTGTPVGDGLTVYEAGTILGRLAASGMMVSIDFVELNPVLDVDDVTSNICMDLLKHVFDNLRNVAEGQMMLG